MFIIFPLTNCAKTNLSARTAIQEFNYDYMYGRPIRIMWTERNPATRRSGVGNLFIKNLDKSIDAKAIYQSFSAFGEILSCKIVYDQNGVSKGYGFVQYDNEESAKLAIESLNGMMVHMKKIYVGPFVPRSQRLNEFPSMEGAIGGDGLPIEAGVGFEGLQSAAMGHVASGPSQEGGKRLRTPIAIQDPKELGMEEKTDKGSEGKSGTKDNENSNETKNEPNSVVENGGTEDQITVQAEIPKLGGIRGTETESNGEEPEPAEDKTESKIEISSEDNQGANEIGQGDSQGQNQNQARTGLNDSKAEPRSDGKGSDQGCDGPPGAGIQLQQSYDGPGDGPPEIRMELESDSPACGGESEGFAISGDGHSAIRMSEKDTACDGPSGKVAEIEDGPSGEVVGIGNGPPGGLGIGDGASGEGVGIQDGPSGKGVGIEDGPPGN